MLLNGIGGIAFGLLYWTQGLESATVAHILTDVIVHGLMPLFFKSGWVIQGGVASG